MHAEPVSARIASVYGHPTQRGTPHTENSDGPFATNGRKVPSANAHAQKAATDLPAILDGLLRLPAVRVRLAVRVTVGVRHVGEHRIEHAGVGRRGGLHVEVDRAPDGLLHGRRRRRDLEPEHVVRRRDDHRVLRERVGRDTVQERLGRVRHGRERAPARGGGERGEPDPRCRVDLVQLLGAGAQQSEGALHGVLWGNARESKPSVGR